MSDTVEIYVRPVEHPTHTFSDTDVRVNYNDTFLDFRNGKIIVRGIPSIKVYEDWEYQEDFGDCVFFNFPSFDGPPEVFCGSPIDSDWDESFTHFIRLDFDDIIRQAGAKK